MLYKDLHDFMDYWMQPINDNRKQLNNYYNKCNKYVLNESYDSTDDNYIISIIVPGIEIDKLDVIVEDNLLNLKYKGLYNNKTEIEFEKQYEFGRNFKFNDDVKCKYNNGILNIFIPKSVKLEKKLQIEA